MMKESDVYEAIMDIGRRRGSVTHEEINEALPSEFFSLDELEEFVGRLENSGVRVIADKAKNN
jgi:RNA polymerase primary sigma factor